MRVENQDLSRLASSFLDLAVQLCRTYFMFHSAEYPCPNLPPPVRTRMRDSQCVCVSVAVLCLFLQVFDVDLCFDLCLFRHIGCLMGSRANINLASSLIVLCWSD